jgi:hypothetical protein
MKTGKIILWLFFFVAAVSLSLSSCKKDSSGSGNPLTSQQTIQVQNSDAQDALADKTEEDIDNNLEELQNNYYVVATSKSFDAGTPTNTVVITVDHPDTITFPKVITINYYTYKDSSANESIIKNGKITITVSKNVPNHARLFSRVFVFTNFSVTTDSTTIIINGTRTVTRAKDAIKFNGITSARISVTDNITANMSFAVATTGITDTLKFTRVVNKVRIAVSYFKNASLTGLNFKHIDSSDTLTYSGTVTGINEKGDAYTKAITIPLIITNYKGSLVVSSGDMTYTIGTTAYYQISFKADPSNKHLTLVTVTNITTGNSRSFDRRFGRIFKKWW